MHITLEQLRVFQAIADAGTFRGAAEQLHKSQPAISRMIQSLEAEIGFPLFSRESYRPSLTEKGRYFLRETRKSLRQMQRLTQMARQLSGSQEAEIHLVMTATCDLEPFLTAVRSIGQAWPETHIRLSQESMGGPLEKLISGDADMVICGLQDVPRNRVELSRIGEVRIIPVCAKDYPAMKLAAPISDESMQDFVQVVVSDKSSSTFQQSRDILEGGLRRTVSDFHAKKQIIEAGLGWGGLPEYLIQQELASGDLIALDLTGFPVRRTEIFKIRLLERPVGPVAQAMWDNL